MTDLGSIEWWLRDLADHLPEGAQMDMGAWAEAYDVPGATAEHRRVTGEQYLVLRWNWKGGEPPSLSKLAERLLEIERGEYGPSLAASALEAAEAMDELAAAGKVVVG